MGIKVQLYKRNNVFSNLLYDMVPVVSSSGLCTEKLCKEGRSHIKYCHQRRQRWRRKREVEGGRGGEGEKNF